MIVDLRTRAWTGRDPLPGGDRSFNTTGRRLSDLDPTPDAHRRAMAVVDAAVVVGWRAERMGVHAPAEQVAAVTHLDPDRLVGFAGIDPTLDSAIDEVDRAVDLGMVGLTIAPADCGCRPTDDRCLAVLERAAARRLPTLVANPCLMDPRSVAEFARPALLDEAARTIKGLTLILGDIGHAWLDEALLMAGKHERVFAEISGVVSRPLALFTTLVTAYERSVMNKLMFASGFPAETPERAIERLYTMSSFRGATQAPGAAAPPREAVRAIVERDALGAIGVEWAGAARSRRAASIGVGEPRPATEAAPT